MLENVKLTGACLTKANMDIVLTESPLLQLPEKKHSEKTDTILNHPVYPELNGLLTTLSTIRFMNMSVKSKIANELINLLEDVGDLSPALPALINELAKPDYASHSNIKTWVNQNCLKYITRYNENIMPQLSKNFITAAIGLFDKHKEYMTTYHGALIQIISQGIQMEDASDNIAVKSLYKHYLHSDKITVWTELSQFDKYDNVRPQWSDKNAQNIILTSATTDDLAILLSANMLHEILQPHPHPQVWRNIILCNKWIEITENHYDQLPVLLHRYFPLIYEAYQNTQQASGVTA